LPIQTYVHHFYQHKQTNTPTTYNVYLKKFVYHSSHYYLEPLPPTSLGPKSSTVDVNLFGTFSSDTILEMPVPLSPVVPPECKPNSPLFKISSKAINVDSPDFAEAFYPKACVVTKPSKNSYVITGPPNLFTTKELHAWAKDTLPDVEKQSLFEING
jgi:hypothetical protein